MIENHPFHRCIMIEDNIFHSGGVHYDIKSSILYQRGAL